MIASRSPSRSWPVAPETAGPTLGPFLLPLTPWERWRVFAFEAAARERGWLPVRYHDCAIRCLTIVARETR